MFLAMMNLFLVLHVLVFDNLSNLIIKVVLFMGSAGLFLNLVTSLRIRYWRDISIWGFALLIPTILELFIIGLSLIVSGGNPSALRLVIASILASMSFSFRNNKLEAEQWEIARRKGFLKRYLDEERWMFDNDPFKMPRLGYALAEATKKTHQYNNSLKWLMRLEKLHFLIPGIAIFVRRAFGNEEIVLGVLLVTLGLVFTSLIRVPFYLKIREWEKEKGKPILLREIWEKEQRHG